MKGSNKHSICKNSETISLNLSAMIKPVITLNTIRKNVTNGIIKCLARCFILILDFISMNTPCSVSALLAKKNFVISPCRGKRKTQIIIVSVIKNFKIATIRKIAAVFNRMSLHCLFIRIILPLKNFIQHIFSTRVTQSSLYHNSVFIKPENHAVQLFEKLHLGYVGNKKSNNKLGGIIWEIL